jgi:hypothetical protein
VQQHEGGAARPAIATLPVTQRRDGKTETTGEEPLGHPGAFPDARHVDGARAVGGLAHHAGLDRLERAGQILLRRYLHGVV